MLITIIAYCILIFLMYQGALWFDNWHDIQPNYKPLMWIAVVFIVLAVYFSVRLTWYCIRIIT